jgi:hypothetical protein
VSNASSEVSKKKIESNETASGKMVIIAIKDNLGAT